MRKPHGSIEVLKKYYNDRLDELTSYFESNLDFYQYYRSKATHLDSHYFVRGHIDFKLCPNRVPYDRDPEFSTCYDHKAAQILANDMLCIVRNIQQGNSTGKTGHRNIYSQIVATTG